LYRSGYGCTEAVFLAFAEAEGYASDAVQLASSMGLDGLCNQGLTCGTLLGGLLVIGVRAAYVNRAYKAPRRRARALGVELIQWYTQRFGSGVCKQLLQLALSDPAQAKNYQPGGYFDRVCVPMLVEMCEWLVQRFAQEAVKV
jgi:C_GCAxxG_C_C family probable redox protein